MYRDRFDELFGRKDVVSKLQTCLTHIKVVPSELRFLCCGMPYITWMTWWVSTGGLTHFQYTRLEVNDKFLTGLKPGKISSRPSCLGRVFTKTFSQSLGKYPIWMDWSIKSANVGRKDIPSLPSITILVLDYGRIAYLVSVFFLISRHHPWVTKCVWDRLFSYIRASQCDVTMGQWRHNQPTQFSDLIIH